MGSVVGESPGPDRDPVVFRRVEVEEDTFGLDRNFANGGIGRANEIPKRLGLAEGQQRGQVSRIDQDRMPPPPAERGQNDTSRTNRPLLDESPNRLRPKVRLVSKRQ